MTRVISWRTHKTVAGYEFTVYSFGYQAPDITMKTGICRTREIATRKAQKWTRWFKAQVSRDANL